MNLGEMFASGPTLKANRRESAPHRDSTLAIWNEVYRCIGVGERTAADVTVKMNRTRKDGTPEFNTKVTHRRLRRMEELGFVSQRMISVEHSTKPVMIWKRVKKPCQ